MDMQKDDGTGATSDRVASTAMIGWMLRFVDYGKHRQTFGVFNRRSNHGTVPLMQSAELS